MSSINGPTFHTELLKGFNDFGVICKKAVPATNLHNYLVYAGENKWDIDWVKLLPINNLLEVLN